jgi:UDP-N-acetylglucosamine 3-dehydrogenase
MLEKEKPDLVNISVPATKHYESAKLCLESGSSVLIEKPMATTVEDSVSLVDLAKKLNLILTVGYTERFSPTIMKMHRIFENGELGYLISMDDRKKAPSLLRARDVDVVKDIGVHGIDRMLDFCNKKVIGVYAVARRVMSLEHEDYAKILISFEGNVTGSVEVDRSTTIRENSFELTGSKATCRDNRTDPSWVNHYLEVIGGLNADGYDFKGLEEYLSKFSPEKVKKSVIKPENPIEPAKLEVNELIDALLNKRSPLVTPESALLSTKIAIASLESSKENKFIHIE